MIFGFASKKEIEKIDKLKHSPEYCNDIQQLSQIQYFITKPSEFQGKIPSKSILTPYSFTCNKSYHIEMQINIFNKKSHVDYRCQYMTIFTIMYTCMFFCFSIFYFIVILYQSRYRPNKKELIVFICILFLLFTAKNIVMSYFFIHIQNDIYEYFNPVKMYTWGGIYPSKIKDISFGCSIPIGVIDFLVDFFILLFLFFNLTNKNILNKFGFVSLVFIVVLIHLLVCIPRENYKEDDDKFMIEIICVLYSLVLFGYLLFKPFFSIIKIGFYFCLIGSFISTSISDGFYQKTSEKIGLHFWFVIFSIISMCSQFISIVLIAFSSMCLDNFVKRKIMNDNIHPNSDSMQQNTESDLDDQKDEIKQIML